MIGDSLLRFQKKQKYFVIDTETEGLNLAQSRPWQVSAAAYEGERLIEEIDMFPWFPDLNVSKQAALVTGFNWESYKRKAAPPVEVCAKIDPYLEDPEYLIIYHNGTGFDSMIRAILRRAAGLKVDYSWLIRAIDTNCLAKAMKKGIMPDRSSPEAFRSWQFKMSGFIQRGLKTNLTAMGKELGIDFDYSTLHIGANDVKLNKLVFDKMLWMIEI